MDEINYFAIINIHSKYHLTTIPIALIEKMYVFKEVET